MNHKLNQMWPTNTTK